jgi:hypothetical protein
MFEADLLGEFSSKHPAYLVGSLEYLNPPQARDKEEAFDFKI